MFNTIKKEWPNDMVSWLKSFPVPLMKKRHFVLGYVLPETFITPLSRVTSLGKRKALSWVHIVNASISRVLVVQTVYFQEGARSCYSEKWSRNSGSKRTGSVIWPQRKINLQGWISRWAKTVQRKSPQERAGPGCVPMKDTLAGHSIFQTHHFGHEECKINWDILNAK